MTATDTIALIVDPDFGFRIQDVAATVQRTWIVDTPANVAIVEQIWKASLTPLGHLAKNGITTFRQCGQDRESWCDAILDSVDDHHNSYRGSPGYALLEVYGTSLTERLRSACVELGFSIFTPTAFGFRACKVQPTIRIRAARSPTRA